MSATSGALVRFLISFKAIAASLSGTATRTISQPAATISSICRIVPSTSVVSVFVIDCTATGAPPPICMPRTITAFDCLFITAFLAEIIIALARLNPTAQALQNCYIFIFYLPKKSRNVVENRENH